MMAELEQQRARWEEERAEAEAAAGRQREELDERRRQLMGQWEVRSTPWQRTSLRSLPDCSRLTPPPDPRCRR